MSLVASELGSGLEANRQTYSGGEKTRWKVISGVM